jgi:hypothetical protein
MRAILTYLPLLFLVLTGYGWAELMVGYVPGTTGAERTIFVECANIEQPVELIARLPSGAQYGSYRLNLEDSEVEITGLESSGGSLFVQTSGATTCRYKVLNRKAIESVVPFKVSDSGETRRHIPPKYPGRENFEVVIINSSDKSSELCANSDCELMEPFATRVVSMGGGVPVLVNSRGQESSFVSFGIARKQGRAIGIFGPAELCEERCSLGLSEIEGTTASFDILPLKGLVPVEVWNTAAVPVERIEVYSTAGIINRSYRNEGKILKVECPFDPVMEPCAAIQSYYSTEDAVVQSVPVRVSNSHIDGRPAFPLLSTDVNASMVFSPLVMLTISRPEMRFAEYRAWGNAAIRTIQGVEIYRAPARKGPVLLPITYDLVEGDPQFEVGQSPKRKEYATCREEVLYLRRGAPSSVVSKIGKTLALVNEAGRLEGLGKVKHAFDKYVQALSLTPIMQCAKDHLFMLESDFHGPSLQSLGTEIKRYELLSIDGYLSLIWSALRTGDIGTSRDFLKEAYEKYPGGDGVLLYMEALIDAVEDNDSGIKEKLERAHRLSPALVLPLIALSRIHRLDGDRVSADELAMKAVAAAKRKLLFPDEDRIGGFWSTIPDKYLQLAMALYEASYSDRTLLVAAQEALRAALALESDLPGGGVYLTSILIDLGDYRSALEYSRLRSPKSQFQPWMLFQRSRAYLYSGHNDQAEAELELSQRARLAGQWIGWFSAVIAGDEFPLQHDGLSIFPVTSESVIPPLLYQFDRPHVLRDDNFSELYDELSHPNRKVRHQAANQVAAYLTESAVRALKLFLSKYREEITEDLLSDSDWSHAALLLQFAPKLTPKEIAGIRALLNSDETKKHFIALHIVYEHGADCAEIIPALRVFMEKKLPTDIVLNALVKALTAIPSTEAEKLLVELAERKKAVTLRQHIIEGLQYGSLSNTAIDKYLEKASTEGGATNIERQARNAFAYRQLRRKMVQIAASQK